MWGYGADLCVAEKSMYNFWLPQILTTTTLCEAHIVRLLTRSRTDHINSQHTFWMLYVGYTVFLIYRKQNVMNNIIRKIHLQFCTAPPKNPGASGPT